MGTLRRVTLLLAAVALLAGRNASATEEQYANFAACWDAMYANYLLCYNADPSNPAHTELCAQDLIRMTNWCYEHYPN